MPETWGLLDKSQVDNQKIDDAIAQAIADHESDPEAHLGEGDSLQSHKASEIIDHKIGSVLMDKFSNTEMILQTNFDSLDRWVLSGATYQDIWPGVTLYCTNVINTISHLYTETMARCGNLIGDKNHFFQCTARVWETDNKIAIFGNCYLSGSTPNGGYGFRWTNGVLEGFWKTDAGLQTVTLTGITMTNFNVYRSQYDKDTHTVTFYVNGINKGSITDVSYTMDTDFIVTFYLKTTVTAEAYLDIVNLLIGNEV